MYLTKEANTPRSFRFCCWFPLEIFILGHLGYPIWISANSDRVVAHATPSKRKAHTKCFFRDAFDKVVSTRGKPF